MSSDSKPESKPDVKPERFYVLYHCGLAADSIEDAQKIAAKLINDKQLESVAIVREVQVVKRPKRRGFVA